MLRAVRYRAAMRTAEIHRNTAETQIDVTVNLDGTGLYTVSTGIGFFDHMIEQLSRHSLIDMNVKTVGDLHVDQHHTTEDKAIAIGEAARAAALLAGRPNVDFADVSRVAAAALAHRLVLHHAAVVGGVTAPEVVQRLLDDVDPVGHDLPAEVR